LIGLVYTYLARHVGRDSDEGAFRALLGDILTGLLDGFKRLNSRQPELLPRQMPDAAVNESWRVQYLYPTRETGRSGEY
jgi:hypothetical protein